MPRVDAIRSEVQRLIHAVPFHPFALVLENGDQIIIGHPENIAFEPSNGKSSGSEEFYVITQKLRLFSTFSAVSSVALVDRGA
jgi:hypothetical protein